MTKELCEKFSNYENAIEISICKPQNIDKFITADIKLANKINKLKIKGLEVMVLRRDLCKTIFCDKLQSVNKILCL